MNIASVLNDSTTILLVFNNNLHIVYKFILTMSNIISRIGIKPFTESTYYLFATMWKSPMSYIPSLSWLFSLFYFNSLWYLVASYLFLNVSIVYFLLYFLPHLPTIQLGINFLCYISNFLLNNSLISFDPVFALVIKSITYKTLYSKSNCKRLNPNIIV